jgi:hypothetical protein
MLMCGGRNINGPGCLKLNTSILKKICIYLTSAEMRQAEILNEEAFVVAPVVRTSDQAVSRDDVEALGTSFAAQNGYFNNLYQL